MMSAVMLRVSKLSVTVLNVVEPSPNHIIKGLTILKFSDKNKAS